ncbi:ArnT family glycosyltransferase [Roseospirillum parvum]|uniref:4-amino-4-deoxy-L-arabinose transferase n=1 Tax=Roseospirillum parvum TaxID=83401 RepID=A0A1G7W6G1_9PROT|nr:glycosyltransferase family 39 protein [Roseospirillum parvum]SDG67516.1 4-amino-4-deoxy-L-arabinose transferase [Roseospirillum parvum]
MHRLLTGWRPYAALALLALMLALPGQATLPVMDRDEARFAQATRQMLETDDFIAIRFQDTARNKKPVGIYWLQAASVATLSTPDSPAIAPYRVPSMLGMVAAVLLTFAVGSRLFDRQTGFVGAALLAGSLQLVIEAHLAKTDAVLLALTLACVFPLAGRYLAARGARPPPARPTAEAVLFWGALGGAILIKGPVVPMVLALTVLALLIADRRRGPGPGWLLGLKPGRGLLLLAAIVLPWFLAVQQATGGAFLGQAVGGDLLPKLLGGQESHGAPPGYHSLLAVLTLWPASLFLLPAVVRSVSRRGEAAVAFLLAWAGPAWLVFELIPTKLPHYVLPLFPALTLLMATVLLAVRDDTPSRLLAKRWWPWIGLWAVIGLTLAGAMPVLVTQYGDASGLPVGLLAAGLGLLVVGGGLWQLARRRPLLAALAPVGAGVLFLGVVFQGVAPALSDLWLSQRAARAIDSLAPGAPVVAAGFHEPSLVFLLGTATELAPGGAAAAARLARDPKAVALVADSEQAAFLTAFQAARPKAPLPEPLIGIEGLNYSRGDPTTLSLYAAPPTD